MNKDEIIIELKDIIFDGCDGIDCDNCKYRHLDYGGGCEEYYIAEKLWEAGYRKVYPQKLCSGTNIELTDEDFERERACEECQEKVKKETAKEILQKIKDRSNWFLESQRQEDHFIEQIKELIEEYGVEENGNT